MSGGIGTADVWILDRRQGTLDRFTVGGGTIPAWSRDGRSIAYAKSDGLYLKAADGTGEARLLLKGTGLSTGSWLPDNKSLLFQASGRPNTLADIGIIALGDSTPRWLVATEFRERQPQLSPDGRWLAYSRIGPASSSCTFSRWPGTVPGSRYRPKAADLRGGARMAGPSITRRAKRGFRSWPPLSGAALLGSRS
jgi:Tol biopolymer transport system component